MLIINTSKELSNSGSARRGKNINMPIKLEIIKNPPKNFMGFNVFLFFIIIFLKKKGQVSSLLHNDSGLPHSFSGLKARPRFEIATGIGLSSIRLMPMMAFGNLFPCYDYPWAQRLLTTQLNWVLRHAGLPGWFSLTLKNTCGKNLPPI